MVRKVSDYSKTVIYKIVCNDLTVKDVYVGHTIDFVKRKSNHKKRCSQHVDGIHSYNYKIYDTIRKHDGWSNWSMLVIEKYPCQTKQEALIRERYYYEQLNSSLNTIRPYCRKEEIKEQSIKWLEDNKDYVKERTKRYVESNKDIIRERKRVYNANHKEQTKITRNIYYQLNKDKMNQNRREKAKVKREKLNTEIELAKQTKEPTN